MLQFAFVWPGGSVICNSHLIKKPFLCLYMANKYNVGTIIII